MRSFGYRTMPEGSSGSDEGIKLTPLGDDEACVTSILKADRNKTNSGLSNSELVDLALSTGAWNKSKSRSELTSELEFESTSELELKSGPMTSQQ
jgi:hypothetical protein